MGVDRKIRLQSKREARLVIKQQLADAEEDILELDAARPTEEELRELEIDEDRQATIISGNDPDGFGRYTTVEEFDRAVGFLPFDPTEDEQKIINETRQRIHNEDIWNKIFIADYYADMEREWDEAVASM